jgi:hypothetical protein
VTQGCGDAGSCWERANPTAAAATERRVRGAAGGSSAREILLRE